MSELLSSDILERQFGETEVERLFWDGITRVICTKAQATGQVLELSQVAFREPGGVEFAAVHQEVVDGKSMGKAFKEQGIAFKRQIHAAYRYDQDHLPDSFVTRFGSHEPPTVIDVSILVGPHNTPYADILEAYSPEVIWNLAGSEMSQSVVERVLALGELLASLEQ